MGQNADGSWSYDGGGNGRRGHRGDNVGDVLGGFGEALLYKEIARFVGGVSESPVSFRWGSGHGYGGNSSVRFDPWRESTTPFPGLFNRGQEEQYPQNNQHRGDSRGHPDYSEQVAVAVPRDFERGAAFNRDEYERIGRPVPKNVARALHSELPRDGEREASVDPRAATETFASLVAQANMGAEGAAEKALVVAEQLRGRDGEIHLSPGIYAFPLLDEAGKAVHDRNGTVMVRMQFTGEDRSADPKALFNTVSSVIAQMGGGSFVDARDRPTIIPAGTPAPERAGEPAAPTIDPATNLDPKGEAPAAASQAPAPKEADVADKAAAAKAPAEPKIVTGGARNYVTNGSHMPPMNSGQVKELQLQLANAGFAGELATATASTGVDGKFGDKTAAIFAQVARDAGVDPKAIDFTKKDNAAAATFNAHLAERVAAIASAPAAVTEVEASASAAASAVSPPPFDGSLAAAPAGLVIPGQAAGAAPTLTEKVHDAAKLAAKFLPLVGPVAGVVAATTLPGISQLFTGGFDGLNAAQSPAADGVSQANSLSQASSYMGKPPEYLNAAKPAEVDYSPLAGVSPLKVPDARTAEQRSQASGRGSA